MENWSTVFSVYYTLNEKEITPHETGQPKTDVESLKKEHSSDALQTTALKNSYLIWKTGVWFFSLLHTK